MEILLVNSKLINFIVIEYDLNTVLADADFYNKKASISNASINVHYHRPYANMDTQFK